MVVSYNRVARSARRTVRTVGPLAELGRLFRPAGTGDGLRSRRRSWPHSRGTEKRSATAGAARRLASAANRPLVIGRHADADLSASEIPHRRRTGPRRAASTDNAEGNHREFAEPLERETKSDRLHR